MSGDEKDAAGLERFLAETCPECGTPGPRRHLSAVNGCRTCMEGDPRPVFTPVRAPKPGGKTEAAVLEEAAALGITQEELDREGAELDRLMQPAGFIPGIGLVSGLAMEMLKDFRFFRNPWSDSKCYRIRAGMVHMRPGCRCPRR